MNFIGIICAIYALIYIGCAIDWGRSFKNMDRAGDFGTKKIVEKIKAL